MILAFFGGVYNNAIALAAAISDARRRGASRLFCLGDMGAFGPHPDRVFPLLRDANVECIQGNYDHSVGNELNDCQCGYTDPQDNFYAKISYDYTFENTSRENRRWMRGLPAELRELPYRFAGGYLAAAAIIGVWGWSRGGEDHDVSDDEQTEHGES